jgi:hypothetical protein
MAYAGLGGLGEVDAPGGPVGYRSILTVLSSAKAMFAQFVGAFPVGCVAVFISVSGQWGGD